jgi:hypothetical protein
MLIILMIHQKKLIILMIPKGDFKNYFIDLSVLALYLPFCPPYSPHFIHL